MEDQEVPVLERQEQETKVMQEQRERNLDSETQEKKPPPSGEAAAFRRVFDLLDTDSDGFISAKELTSALREPEIKKFIARTYVLQLLVEKEDHEQIFLAMDSKLFLSAHLLHNTSCPLFSRSSPFTSGLLYSLQFALHVCTANKDGRISFPEFRQFCEKKHDAEAAQNLLEKETLEMLRTLFGMLDKDMSGGVKRSELLKALRGNREVMVMMSSCKELRVLLKPSAWKRIFTEMDLDNSGEVSFEE